MTRLVFALALAVAATSTPALAASCKNGETKVRNSVQYTCFCNSNGSCMWRAD